MLDIAIQIVNYKTKQYTLDCIRDVVNDLKDAGIAYRIFVLDNDSGDRFDDIVGQYSNVEFHYSNKNVGFGEGHNILSAKSESEYLLLLNPDIIFIQDETIKRLYKRIKGNSNVMRVIGPQLITADGSPQAWDHGESRGWKARVTRFFCESYWIERESESEVGWVSGAFFLIERNIFTDIGRFDPNFFLYDEEVDLCIRIRQKGYQVWYYPEVKVKHYGSVVASKDKFLKKSRNYLIEKHTKGKIYGSFVKMVNKIQGKI